MPIEKQQLAARLPQSWIGWLVLGLLLMLGIISLGALLGGLLFPVVGTLMGIDLSLGEMTRNGIFDGGFLATIWAPGLSFVACLMLANFKGRTMGRGRA